MGINWSIQCRQNIWFHLCITIFYYEFLFYIVPLPPHRIDIEQFNKQLRTFGIKTLRFNIPHHISTPSIQFHDGDITYSVSGNCSIVVTSIQFTWWRHQMETFSALLAICAGNSPIPGEFPTQRPVTRSFDVYFDLRPDKRLSKQSWAGDLRRYRTHYDVIVMMSP